MRLFRRSIPFAEAVPSRKGVTISHSDGENWQRNQITVRTVNYNGALPGMSSYGLLYRRQPAVRAVVDFLARNIGQLNPKVYERVDNTDRIEVTDHPVAVLLRHPNPSTTRYAHLRDTVSDVAIYDRAYWRKIREGRSRAVYRIPPTSLEIEYQDGVRVYRDRNGVLIPRDELVIFRGYSPDGSEDGVSPLETLRRVLQEESASVQHRENMWLNAARQSGFIERPGDAPEWSDEARQRFRADVEGTLSGGHNAGRIGVLEDGMTWNPSSFSPKDTEYIAGRRLTYEEVAIAYGVPPVIIGMGTETKSNAEQFHRQVYQDVLGPWLRMLQDEIELQLLRDFEPLGGNTYVEFNLSEKLKGSFEEQQKALTTAVGVPHMSINEGRARLNLPRIDGDWADTPVQPLNVMYGGQAATTLPTADPGTASFEPKVKRAVPPQVIRRRDGAAKDHEALLVKFFNRQQAALQAKATPDVDRWNRELTADLYLLATTVTRKSGLLAARQLDGVYDELRVLPFLAENARIAAESINKATFAALAVALTADERRAVFEAAREVRATQLGTSRATSLIAFARMEAAKHSEDADGRPRMKTWVVTSGNSRHPSMNGETVPVRESFSNGLPWPGAHGDPDESAGCQCLLALS